jgi:RNA recognition motif-containing protein
VTAEEKMMNVEEPASPDTLLVRRLPDELTERDLNDLFRGYFGAVEVRREKRLSRRNSNVYIK